MSAHRGEFQAHVSTQLDVLRDARWDALLARSRARTVFLRSAWLTPVWKAWHEDDSVYVVRVTLGDRWVAAGAFVASRATLRLLGEGPSDYLELIVDRALSDRAARDALGLLAEAALEASGCRALALRGVPIWNRMPEHLRDAGWHVVTTRRTVAPSMEQAAFAGAARKKSLKRKRNRLAREGALHCETYGDAARTLELLPELFDLHRRRWASAGHASQFDRPRERWLYAALAESLGASGMLRTSEVRLDGRLIAAHFGAYDGERFTWYKPCYEPELESFGPGEVLLQHLIERAASEGAREFDFTVGAEGFKLRFATLVRPVHDVWVGRDFWGYVRTRERVEWRRLAKRALGR